MENSEKKWFASLSYPTFTKHSPDDLAKRLQFCEWINANQRSLLLIMFLDKASFNREGIQNTRYSHVWSHQNLHEPSFNTSFQ